MIRELTPRNADTIFNIVNKADVAYKGAISVDCYHEPYMTKEELFALKRRGLLNVYYKVDNKLNNK